MCYERTVNYPFGRIVGNPYICPSRSSQSLGCLGYAKSAGERLVCQRSSAGSSQKEAALQLRIDPSTLARYERGERLPTGATSRKVGGLMNPANGSRCCFDKLDRHWIKLKPVPNLYMSGVFHPSGSRFYSNDARLGGCPWIRHREVTEDHRERRSVEDLAR